MKILDELYTRTPFYGVRRMTACLREKGIELNHKRIARLMEKIGLQAIYPKPKLSLASNNKVYPYLLRQLKIERKDQVWTSDITYIRLKQGFLYLVAILDLYSRYCISWELSNSLDTNFCLVALRKALKISKPEIFNTDQGSQFTSRDFTSCLESAGIRISMDGRGRAFDNIFIERLWRTVKYEAVYLKNYSSPIETRSSLHDFFLFYNSERLHQSLNYKTPSSLYFGLF